MSRTSRRTGDQLNPSSTSRPTAPPATPTPPTETSVHVRPVGRVQIQPTGQVPPNGNRLENEAGGDAKPGTSQATDSVQSVQPKQPELSGRTATPVRGSSAGRATKMIAHKLAQKIEAECRLCYGVTAGTLKIGP